MKKRTSERPLIIVTGSSGFIGYRICERLSRHAIVAGLDRPGMPHPPPSTHRVDVDLRSDESVRRALDEVRRSHGTRVASVVHLAAYYDFSGANSPLYEEITLRGTARLLEQLRAFEVEQFLFSSTMLVHAPCRLGDRVTESSPIRPKWAYPESKAKTERLIRASRGRMRAVLLRMAGVYDDECHSIPIANQIQRIYERQLTSHFFAGNPASGQSFIHLDDIESIVRSLIERRRELPAELPLLAGEPETLSYGTLQDMLGRLIHGVSWRTNSVPKPLARVGAAVRNAVPFGRESFIKPWMMRISDDHYALDIDRARSLLGWFPKRSLRETLPAMVAFLKKDPARFYDENKLEAPRWLDEWRAVRKKIVDADARRPDSPIGEAAGRRP